jgi:hypothetical protein
MVNQELIGWVKKCKEKGFNPAQIRNYLLQNNYSLEEANKILEFSNQKNKNSSKTNSKKNTKKHIFIIILIIFLVLMILFFGFRYLVISKFNQTLNLNNSLTSQNSSENNLYNNGINNTNVNNESEETLNSSQSNNDSFCLEYPDKLENCEIYACEYEHPLTGELMTKEILGIIDGNCKTVETMPNNGTLTCELNEEFRLAISKYYKDLLNASNQSVSVQSNLGGNEEITYTLNGEEVINPSQEAMNQGHCVISGYS